MTRLCSTNAFFSKKKVQTNLHCTLLMIPFRMSRSRVSVGHLRSLCQGSHFQVCSSGESLAACMRLVQLGILVSYLPLQKLTTCTIWSVRIFSENDQTKESNLFSSCTRVPQNESSIQTIDFSGAFDTVWHSALSAGCWLWVFRLALSAGPGPFCRAEGRGFSSVALGTAHFVSGVGPSGLRPWSSPLRPVCLTGALPWGTRCSLCAGGLAIWSFSPGLLGVARSIQGALDHLGSGASWSIPLNVSVASLARNPVGPCIDLGLLWLVPPRI